MAKSKRYIEENRTPHGTRLRIEVDDPTKPTVTDEVKDLIAQARRRFKMAAEAEDYNRREGLIDLRMVDGEGQWDADIAAVRRRKRRPCLTINRFITMLAYMENEQRQLNLGIQVHPTGDGADVDGAQIRQGLIRNIENESHAQVVYDTAFVRMLEKGWSWFRVISEYESADSFNQVLRIAGFVNDFCVYVDPNAQEPTRRDMDWAFVIEDIPRGEYASLYPDSVAATLTDFRGVGDDAAEWITPEAIRVAEYYYTDYVEATLIKLVDGSGRWKDELKEENGIYFDQRTGQPVPVEFDEEGNTVERPGRKRTVKWCKINACEILEGNKDKTGGRDLKAHWIPLIMVSGRERSIDGQRRLAGMVRHNREAQRIYNYLTSAYVEGVALAPKAPFVVEASQIAQYKNIWDSLNEENWPYLPYDAVTKDMQPVAPPQRQNAEPPVQAVGTGIVQFDNIIKAGFNIFDSALGKAGSQQSSKSMQFGKTQSDSANFHWTDNLSRSLQHAGEVILDMMPTRYDGPRVVTITRPNDQRQEVLINQLFNNPNGDEKIYDMARGKYSCVVTAGLTNITRRDQSLQAMFSLMEADPQLTPMILDLVLENMDWPGAQQIAARLKKALPPALQDQDPNSPQGQIPPQVQQQIQQLLMTHQQLQQEFAQAQAIIKGKQVEGEWHTKIAQLQTQALMAIAAAKFQNEAQIKELELEFKRVAELMKNARETGSLRNDAIGNVLDHQGKQLEVGQRHIAEVMKDARERDAQAQQAQEGQSGGSSV